MPETVWCVFRFAVYRHQVIGVFSSEILARQAIAKISDTEPDGRHGYELMACEVDRASDVIPGEDWTRYRVIEPDTICVIEPFREVLRCLNPA